MKKLLSIAFVMAVILAMVVPAYASADVITSVTVGNGGATQPIVLAMAMVPDNGTGTTGLGQVEVDPEAAIPVNQDFITGTLALGSDGWKMVKFYVIAYHPSEFEFNINKVSINVYYDADHTDRKFEIDGIRTGTSHSWTGTESYNDPVYYPAVALGDTPELAVLPNWTAKELLYTEAIKNLVDINADDVYGGSDPNVIGFLQQYGARVKYSSDSNANIATIENLLLEEQAIVLELTGFIWFHQPAQTYFSEAKVSSNGADSNPLYDSFVFNKLVSFYLDTPTVVYGPTTPNADVSSQAPADSWLSTVGPTTIWDNGNTNAQVSLKSTKMVLGWNGQGANPVDYNDPLKTIVSFDGALYYANAGGATVQVGHINYTADQSPMLIENNMNNPVERGTLGAVLLQACRPAKIEFSVRPGNVWQGTYGGRLTISVAEYAGSQTVLN